MQAIELVRIGPEDWREFREVRLASLSDAPSAFGSRHADWVEAAEHRWRARLTDVAFTVVARRDGEPVGVASGAVGAVHGTHLHVGRSQSTRHRLGRANHC